jgi:hypothetical protein
MVQNAPWFFERGFAMIKPLLNESTIEQLKIHSDNAAAELGLLMEPSELEALAQAPLIARGQHHQRGGEADSSKSGPFSW